MIDGLGRYLHRDAMKKLVNNPVYITPSSWAALAQGRCGQKAVVIIIIVSYLIR